MRSTSIASMKNRRPLHDYRFRNFEPPEGTEKHCIRNRMNLTYSRYADDLTVASNDLNILKELYGKVETIVNSEGYTLNPQKARYYSGKQKMVVTGLLLNSGHLTTGRDCKRPIRAALYNYIARQDDAVEIDKVLGTVAFIRGIEPAYYTRLKKYISNLKQRWSESKRWREIP